MVALSFCASYRVNSYKSAAPKLFLREIAGDVGFLSFGPIVEYWCNFAGEIAIRRRAKNFWNFAHVAQSVEHVLGKDEVISSILIMGSIFDGRAVADIKIAAAEAACGEEQTVNC
jgi:hypothetical protein